MKRTGMLYRMKYCGKNILSAVIDILYYPGETESNFYLNEKKVYIRIDTYWVFLRKLKEIIDTLDAFYVGERYSEESYINDFNNYDSNENKQDLSIIQEEICLWISSLLENQIDRKCMLLGMHLNEKEIFVNHKGKKYVQLYLVKLINYIFHWEYLVGARYTPILGKKNYVEAERPLILVKEERKRNFIDEESTLISHIERLVKKRHFIEIEDNNVPELKRRKVHNNSSIDYDSEENIMRSFFNDTSENFGF